MEMNIQQEMLFPNEDVNWIASFSENVTNIKKEKNWDEYESFQQTDQLCPFQLGAIPGTGDLECRESNVIEPVEKDSLISEIERSFLISEIENIENSQEDVNFMEPNFETSIFIQEEECLDEKDLFTQMVNLGVFQLVASDCQETPSVVSKPKRRRSSTSSRSSRYDDGLVWKIDCEIFIHVSILSRIHGREGLTLVSLTSQAYNLAIAGLHPPIPAEEEDSTPLLLQVGQEDDLVSRISDAIQRMQIVTHKIIKLKMRMTQLRVYINIFSSNWSQDKMEQMENVEKETSSQDEDINWISLISEETDCEKKEDSLEEDELFSQMVRLGAFQSAAMNRLSDASRLGSKKKAKGVIYISRRTQMLMELVYKRIIEVINSLRNIVGKNRASLRKLIQQTYRIAENSCAPAVPVEEPEAILPLLEVMQIEDRLPFPLKQILYLLRKMQVIYFNLTNQKMRITQLRTYILICGHQPADNVEPNLEPFSL